VLFTSLLLLTIGYAMVFSALHGNWQFWTYLFPKSQPPAALAQTATAAA
jgi:hypothetical protein